MFGIDDLIGAGLKLLDKVIPDPAAKAAAQAELMKMQHVELMAVMGIEGEIAKSQIAVNAEEAKSSSLFVAGWRPFIGWVCGCAFAYHFVALPFLAFVLAIFGVAVALPAFDMSSLMTVLMGMLGLGGFRMYEKLKGVAR